MKVKLLEVYHFWFSKKNDYDKWFLNSNKYDLYITTHFKSLLDYYIRNYKTINLSEYSFKELVSLLILFDQFTRQIYRDTAKAYSMDFIAIDITRYILEQKLLSIYSENEQLFILLPLQHSENINDLDLLLYLLYELDNNKLFLHHTIEHKKVLEKWGRYPKRNKYLNRESSPEEIIYIEENNDRDY